MGISQSVLGSIPAVTSTSGEAHKNSEICKQSGIFSLAEVGDAGQLLIQSLIQEIGDCVPYDARKQFLGDDHIAYSRQVHYSRQCPKGHELVSLMVCLDVEAGLKLRAADTEYLSISAPVRDTKQPTKFEPDQLHLITSFLGTKKQHTTQNDLRKACAEGNMDLVRMLLDQGADVNCQDNTGLTPLHACVFSANIELALLLLNRGADQMQGDESEMAPIHYAAADGALDLFRIFVKFAGTSVAGLVGAHGITPAHMAANTGQDHVLSYICEECGPEYCKQLDCQDNSPLHLASSMGHVDCIDILLQNGCSANMRNCHHMTPLMVALKANDVSGYIAAIRLLLPFTEILETDNIVIPSEVINETHFCSSISPFKEISEDVATLHATVLWGSISQLRELLFSGAKIDEYDDTGSTPFHHACATNRLDMVALMLNFGKLQQLETSLVKPGTKSPLICAISSHSCPVVQYLIRKFPSWLEVRSVEGVLPVAIALDSGCSMSLLRALVIGGANLNAVAKSFGFDHMTSASQAISIHEYASAFDTDAAKIVQVAGMDRISSKSPWFDELVEPLDVWNRGECSLVHRLSFQGNVLELQDLFSSGSVTETKDGLGFTALHAACAGGFLSTVDALLKHNFSVDSNDNNAGLSPLFFAVNGGFCLLVERLLPLVANESSLYDARGRSLLLFLPSDENAALAISTMMLSTFPFIDGDAESDLVSQHIEHTRFRVQSAALHISNIDPTSLSNLLNDLPCLIYCRMNGEGCTLLHMACEQLEAFMCVEVLCRMGAPVEAVMSNGVSPLHVAAVSKNLTAMSTLLSYGGSPDLPDHNDLTPLQIAVASSFSAGIELLVKEWHAYSMNADTTCSTADRIDDCFKNFPQTATCAGVLGEHISDKRACKVTDTIIDKIDVSNQSNLSINNGLFLSQNLTLICRICSTPAYHSDISGWLTCSTKTCCDSYTVCASCINILKENDLSPETSIPKSISKPAACDGNVSFKRGKSSIYATKNERAFDKKGVRLNFLRTFKEQHSKICSHMTSEQVCHLVIKPQTALFRRSVAFELSRNDQMHDWGPQANWFVCHAWSNLFFPMIDAILNFFQHRVDAADAVIWMDLFCVSQHTDPEVPVSPMWWAGFSERIEDAGNMILVIDSWKDPKPLKRSWCVMEILISLHSLVQHGVGFFKVLIYEEDTAFREIFRAVRDNPEEFSSTLSQLCLGIAVESSQCTFVEEHAYIMEKIEQMGAFRMLNENLSNIIEEWIFEMLNQVTQEVSNAGDEYELFNFRMCLAEVFSGMGRHFEALRQKEMCVAWHHKMLATHLENGNDDIIVPTISVADSMISVAESYARLNRFHDSLKFQEEAQKYYLRVLHQNDIRHANITSCIAQTHLSLENRNAAIQLIRSSLEMHRRVLPENDPRTLCAEAAVACMYRSAQNFEDAYDLEKQVLAKRLQVLPFNHPDIGSSYFNMAITLPLVESLPLSHKNWSVLHNLESALKVWKYSLKASDPRLQLVKQKIRVFQESIVKDASACVCPSDL